MDTAEPGDSPLAIKELCTLVSLNSGYAYGKFGLMSGETLGPGDQEFTSPLEQPVEPSQSPRASRWGKTAARVGVVLATAGLAGAPTTIAEHEPVRSPETSAAPERAPNPLTAAERQQLAEAFTGLAEHDLKAIDRFDSAQGPVTVASLDGARPTVTPESLKRRLDYFDRVAATRPSFDYDIKYRGRPLKLHYQVSPTARPRYFIFAPESQDMSAIAPEYAPGEAPPGFTTNNLSEGEGRVSVSVIKATPGQLGPEPVSQTLTLNDFYASAEACQSAANVTTSESPSRWDLLGQEVYCNSGALRDIEQDAAKYQQLVTERGTLLGYESEEAKFINFPPAG
jgi:hypothetical protein